jgi:hypothetical protein
MANETKSPAAYQPYRTEPKDRDGCNDLVANENNPGAEPEVPAGWENGIDRSTSKERGE